LNGSRGGQSAGMIRIEESDSLAYPIGMIIPPGKKGGHTINIECGGGGGVGVYYKQDVGVTSATLESFATNSEYNTNTDSLQFGTLSQNITDGGGTYYAFHKDPDDVLGGSSNGVGGDSFYSWDTTISNPGIVTGHEGGTYTVLGRQSTGNRYSWLRSSYDFRLIGVSAYGDFAPQFHRGLATDIGGITVKDSQGAADNATYDLKVNGSIGATSNITAYVSDERLKENITTIDSGLGIIDKVRPIEFDWNDKSKEIGFEPQNEHEYGFSAQQLQEVFPDAVAPSPINKGGTDMDYLTVQPEKLIPLLVGAVKEQNVQINYLKERIKKLENE